MTFGGNFVALRVRSFEPRTAARNFALAAASWPLPT